MITAYGSTVIMKTVWGILMRAVVWTKYGSPDGLQLQEVEKPAPKDNEVLIKIHATSVTAGDCEVRALKFPIWLALPIRLYMGVTNPRNKILGQELAGEVEAVGKAVQSFKVGDQVFGTTGFNFGAYAEYIRLPDKSDSAALAIKPANVTYEEAACVPTGGLEALHFLRRANIQPGQKLLIIGSGGSIGTFAVQLGKHFGAEVTGVDSTAKLEMVRSIGADHVIDYTKEDFAQNGAAYDAVLDVVGKGTFARAIEVLKPYGRYLLANPRLSAMLQGVWISRDSGKEVITATVTQTREDLDFLKTLMQAGKLKPVIDRRYALEQIADAHRYVETGQKQGNVVITVDSQ